MLFFFILTSCTYDEIIPVCIPDKQDFVERVQPIIENNCVMCHNVLSSRPSVLTTYDGVIDAVNNHFLVNQVLDLHMPPPDMPPLTLSEINIIKNWAYCE